MAADFLLFRCPADAGYPNRRMPPDIANGFAVGHWSGATPRRMGPPEQSPISETGAEHQQGGPSAMTDYSSVMIENLGQVGFDQALGMLHSAPKEALTAWTKRLEALPVGPRRTRVTRSSDACA